MRRVAHGEAYFGDNTPMILQLMKDQCSAMRSAYQSIHKHGLKGNDVRKKVKRNYMSSLNQRYINDACTIAGSIGHESVIFGGKKAWKHLNVGLMSKEEWSTRRNNQLYSRGDRAKSGNPNIRISDDSVFVNNPVNRGEWIRGKFFMPDKFNINMSCYDVRLRYVNGKFKVIISWDENDPALIPLRKGAVGIDINPDGVGLVEVDDNGNLLHHHYESSGRIEFASYEKRDYDIFEIAKRVVQYAVDVRKPIVLEKLSFKNSNKGRKFNRMASNFVHRKIHSAIVSRAKRYGIKVIDVQPAFTSILGQLKYQNMYSLNRHTAAALVIARRSMGIKERKDFEVKPSKSKRADLNLEGRGCAVALTNKAWSWLEECFLKPNIVPFTGAGLATDSKSVTGLSVGETPASESIAITSRYGVEVKNSTGRRKASFQDFPILVN